MNRTMHQMARLVFVAVFGLGIMYAQEIAPKSYEVVLESRYSEAEDFIGGLALVQIGSPAFISWSVINREGQIIMDAAFGINTVGYMRNRLKEFPGSPDKIRRFFDEGKWIFVDREGSIISKIPRVDAKDDRIYALIEPAEFENDYKNPLFPIKSAPKWGYRNLENKTAIDFQFEDARPFSQGMAAAKKEKKWGYIDREGRFLIDPQYDRAGDFCGGLAAVRKGKAWGLINTAGMLVADCQYEEIGTVGRGLIPVRMNKKWGFLDAQGRPAAECQYEEIEEPSEGMVPVRLNKKWGYLDDQGRSAVECQYRDVEAFSNGLAKAQKDKNWGVIDRSGRVIIPFEFPYLGEFYDGMIAFSNQNPNRQGTDTRYGFLNDRGKVIVEPRYKAVTSYYQGLAEVMDDDDMLGLVDREGNMVLDCLYHFIGLTFENLWTGNHSFLGPLNTRRGFIITQFGESTTYFGMLMDEYGLEDFLDITNLDRIKKRYDLLTGVTRNAFGPLIPVLPDDKKWGFVDRDGKVVIECVYDEVMPFREGLAAVKLNDKWGYVDEKGDVLIPCQFANAGSFSEGLAAVNMATGALKHKRYGFINKEGKLAIDYEFALVGKFSEGLARVTLKDPKVFGAKSIWGYIRLKKNQ